MSIPGPARLALLLGILAALLGVARAEEPYAGKTISLYAGRPPGGAIDLEARLVAEFLPRHIPGTPRIQLQHMPGAGGIKLANFLHEAAPKDGLTLGIPGRTSFVMAAVLRNNPNVRYDLRDFTWIGSGTGSNYVLLVRKAAGVGSLEALRRAERKLVIGGGTASSADVIVPELLAKYQGLPLTVVKGFAGRAELALALERGEIDGMFIDPDGFQSDPVAAGLAVPVLQTFPILPGLPALTEIASDPLERGLLKLVAVPLKMGVPLVAPPGLPEEQTRILREAYVRMVDDPDYRAAARQRGLDVGAPTPGEELARYLADNLGGLSSEVVAAFRSYAGE